MIESALVRRLAAITLLVAAAFSGLALVLGSPRVAGGIGAGAVLGLLPIVTWSILGGLLMSARAPLLFGAISLGKLLVYAGALAILIGRNLVDPLALAAALLAPGLMLAALVSARREAAR
jgi:hypothetical protein